MLNKAIKKTKNSVFFLLFIITILSLMITACAKESKKEEGQIKTIKVKTSLFALEHFVKTLLPEAEVESVIPSGVDPHHFEPSLKDIQKLYDSSLIIYIGDTDVDRWIDKIKDELINKGVKMLRLQDSLSLIKYSSSKEVDPHLWLDPVLSLEILRLIKQSAIEILPNKREFIEKNFVSYEQKLKELDKAYRDVLSKCRLKDAISSHEFLNYLGARYGFNSHFIVHEPEDEPSPKRIKVLKELVRKNSIEYIITEPEGEKISKTLSQETGAKPLSFNTYHTKTERDYLNVMRDNLKVLATALKCEIKNGQ